MPRKPKPRYRVVAKRSAEFKGWWCWALFNDANHEFVAQSCGNWTSRRVATCAGKEICREISRDESKEKNTFEKLKSCEAAHKAATVSFLRAAAEVHAERVRRLAAERAIAQMRKWLRASELMAAPSNYERRTALDDALSELARLQRAAKKGKR